MTLIPFAIGRDTMEVPQHPLHKPSSPEKR